MKAVIFLLACCFLFRFVPVTAGTKHTDHVYVIYYATYKGRTGHIGIALDNYRILYADKKQGDSVVSVADTVLSGELTYFDMWPDEDHFSVARTGRDIPGVYYKLPVSSTEEITLQSLYDKGIPHKENYPVDGILKIKSGYAQDKWLLTILDSLVISNQPFNARRFNCSDFVRIPIEQLLNRSIKCREFIGVGWSSTPNKLYRTLLRLELVTVIKNGDAVSRGSFLGQRVFYRLFHRRKSKQEKLTRRIICNCSTGIVLFITKNKQHEYMV